MNSVGEPAAAGDRFLRAGLGGAWSQLPVLLVGSAAVTAATAVAVLAARAWAVAGVIAVVLLVAPTVMALIRCATDIIDGSDVRVASYPAALRTLAGRAIGSAAVPAVFAALTIVAVVARERGGPVFWLPTVLGVTGTALTLGALLVLLPLRARHAEPAGVAAWLLALHVLGRSPIPFVAAAVVAAGGVWAATALSNGLFLLVPGPFALVLAAAYRTSPAERLLGAR